MKTSYFIGCNIKNPFKVNKNLTVPLCNLIAWNKDYLCLPMGNRRLISAACILAFAMVLLHSAIPHTHHCTVRENHIHHHYNCGQLGTYLQSSDDDIQLFIGDLLESGGPDAGRGGSAERRIFDSGDHFQAAPAASLPQLSLRGPPEH